MQEIGNRLESLALTPPATGQQPMKRPGVGTRGERFKVRVNTFRVKFPEITCYHYDVKIGNGEYSKKVNRRVWAYLANEMRVFEEVPVAYDGKAMAYSPTKLLANEGAWDINLPEADGRPSSSRGNHFAVKITFIRSVDLSLLTTFVRGVPGLDPVDVMSAVQALNVAIQHQSMMTYPSRSASFFVPPTNLQAVALTRGLEMWKGYYTSLRPGPGSVFINVDLSSCPMIGSGSLPALMLRFADGATRNARPSDITRLEPRVQIELGRFLTGLRISLSVRALSDGKFPHRKIIEFLPRVTVGSVRFDDANGRSTTMTEYFRHHYAIDLQFPNWPVVRVSKIALWPVELVNVDAGQKFGRKLDPVQTANSLKLTTVGPRERPAILGQGITSISPSNNASFLNNWGISINPSLMEVTARALPPPKIVYKREIVPKDGVWDIRGQQFILPAFVKQWIVLVFDNPNHFRLAEAQTAVVGLVEALTRLGMNVANPRPHIEYAPPRLELNRISDFIRTAAKKPEANLKGPPDLVVCFVQKKPSPEYGFIKRFGDVEVGVATQVLSIPKVKKANQQYWTNVALKINVKKGGTNSVLTKQDFGAFAESTMIFGADVTHPAPGSTNPSIAAVVGSMDPQVSVYGTQVSVQKSRVEIIQELAKMAEKLIRQHISMNKPPKRIVYFRDGVSEGQFDAVLDHEANALRVACQHISLDYKPNLTFIVCGKRHHMSFFPINPRNADPKNGNVKAGTTIDTEITSPFQFDWYTQSHASLLGTGRSCHYTVLLDDSSFSADQLQQLVFNICFTYARCTRSVSYATPAYYADRLAERASVILNAGADEDASTVTSHSGESLDRARVSRLTDFRLRFKEIHVNHMTNLFFM